MGENASYGSVVGNRTKAPYINKTLVAQCGTARQMYGATHWSAANYLAITAGQYPSTSPRGCSTPRQCATSTDNLFSQTEAAGLSWTSYMEAMPQPCAPATSGDYKLGHNPAVFYTRLTDCSTRDLPVPSLTAQSGAFWSDLSNQTLPSFAFISPSEANNGEDNGLTSFDTWLSRFIPLVQGSPAYQAGDTAIFVTFDEGNGSDAVQGENCTNQTADLAGRQESCHLPFFVVYPYTPAGKLSGFYDHYSVTRTIEELLGLPLLAGAANAPSLLGHFGLNLVVTPPAPVNGLAATAFGVSSAYLSWTVPDETVRGDHTLVVAQRGAPPASSATKEQVYSGIGTTAVAGGLAAGSDYTVTVTNVATDGTPSTPATLSLHGTHVSATAPTSTLAGKSATVTATLTRHGAALPGRTLRLQQRPAGTTTWTTTLVAPTTSSTGTASFAVTPTRNESYRVVFAGAARDLGSVSAPLIVRVVPQVTARLSASTVRSGRRVTMTVKVKPNQHGHQVDLQVHRSTGWHTVAARALTTAGTTSFTIATPSTGKRRYRVFDPATAKQAAGRSTTQTLRVTA